MKRGLPLLLLFLGLARCLAQEQPAGRAMTFDLGVTFTLPAGWLVLQEPSAVPTASAGWKEPVLLFYARPDEPSFMPGPKTLNDAWVSVSKLAVADARPGAGDLAETAGLKEGLTQEGYRISESEVFAQNEGDVRSSCARFYCYSETGPPIIVEATRWQANGEVIAVQLRYSEAVRADLKEEIKKLKASFLLKGQPTLAFGEGKRKVDETVAAASPGSPAAPSPAAPAPASPSPAATPTSEEQTAAILRDLTGSLVTIQGGSNAGSGFVCTLAREKCLVTSNHVLIANRAPKYTLLDGTPIAVGAAYSAVDHDVLSFLVTAGGKPVDVLQNIDQNVLVGDEVLVLRTAPGQGVVKAIPGTVLGIGPNLVEVNAPFGGGDSGSPIIQKKTGKVIGVAAQIAEKAPQADGADRPPRRVVKRFAYRLDSIRQWQPVSWPQFYNECDKMDKIYGVTRDIETFCSQLANGGALRPGAYKSPSILAPIEDYVQTTGMSRMSSYDLVNAKKNLLASILSASQLDVSQAKMKITYDYFLHRLEDQRQERAALAKFFEKAGDLQAGSAHP